MAQEQENEILIEVKLDEAATEKRVTDLKLKIMALREEKKKLTQEFKEQKISSEEYNAAIVKNEASVRALTKEVQSNQRALDLNEKVTKSASGSLNQMRAQLAQYKDMIGDLSAEERASKAGQQLIRETDELNDKVTEIEKSYGQYGRAVGRYADGIREVIDEQVPMIGQLQQIKTFLTTSINYLKENRENWLDQAKSINLSSISVTGFGKAAKAAFAATGIGVLVLALGALLGFLTKSQVGMDYLERKTKAFGAVVSLVSGKIADLGGMMVDAWEKPGEAIKKLGDFIEQNLINRVKGFGVILKAINNGHWTGLVDGVIQIGTGITDASGKVDSLANGLSRAAREGARVAAEGQKIRDLAIIMEAKYKQMRGEAERLKQIADDTTKPYNERLAAIRKASEIETKLQIEREKFQKRIIANVKAEANINGNNYEDRKKVAEAEAELGDIREERYERATEMQNTLNGLVEEQKQKQIEAAKEAMNAQIANNEVRLRAAQRAGRDTLAVESELIRQRAELEKVDVKNKAQRKAIDAKAEADILDLRVAKAVEEQNRLFRVEESGINARLALVKQGLKEEADLIKIRISNQAQQERINAGFTIKNREELNAKLAEIDANEKAQLLAVDNNLKAQLAQNNVTAIQARLNAVQEGTEAEFKIRKELLDAQLKAELENVALTEAQKAEIRTRYAKEQAQVDFERAVKQKADEVTAAQSRLNVTRAGSQAEYKERQKMLDLQRDLELKQAGQNEVLKEEIRTRYARAQKDLTKQYYDDLTTIAASSIQQATSTLSAIYEAQEAIQARSLANQEKAALKSAGFNAELRERVEAQFQKKREEMEEKANKKKKTVAKLEATVNTAVAATKALTAGPILGPILAGLITLQGLAQIATINAQNLADGGVPYATHFQSDGRGAIVRGPGTSRSDSIRANLSNGEAVMNANTTRMFYNELSAMNVAGGGRAFPGATSTAVPGFNYGGVALQTDYSALVAAFREGAKGIRPVVAVKDFHRVESYTIRTEIRADV
ncbi:hypothetical protein [Larkinella arboricola]